MNEETFDLEAFYVLVEAPRKERNALRQDLIRGLKDYYESLYGYDRYGAETGFLLEERMGQPYVFGFGVQRVLHDRRLSALTKLAVAGQAIERMRYGADFGLPFGILNAVEFLGAAERLSTEDARYVLVASAGEYHPFRGMEKPAMLSLMRRLLGLSDMPELEKAFWGHSLVARHQNLAGAADLVRTVLRARSIPPEVRNELALAWIYMRQPRLDVPVPLERGNARSTFVAEHMPFWVAHMPSWSSSTMVRLGLAALPSFGTDPVELAQTYIAYRDGEVDAIHNAVVDVLADYHAAMPSRIVRAVIERGIALPGSVSVRRRFYRLGTDLYGSEYLERATHDSAGSVRQWASRQLQKQA